ncbi:DEAD/DEAH box helicase [Kitasatospora sp. MAP5-34]|uniref:DEAD/DEAH box helicase n=1 Tax=Kitasatospora sp. MAP5-34 TaxID=3035102 RepID=UPI002473FAE1|nr:DEAD/DEAH box helicase [Kitasatospora sp. MAP5-34]MDH6580728.1 superfamily II DNA or RNA helicase [Kitasatospora sp. MAP5-34]
MSIVKPGLTAAKAAAGITLRHHQEEALAAIVRALTPRPGLLTPNGLRATVQMATGSGKSFVGAAAGQKLAPNGAVLVVVPTLDLLLQMIGAWKAGGRAGEMFAVCSLTSGALPPGVRGSTNGVQIAMWLDEAAKGRRPVTLFATYASAGAVRDAYEIGPRFLGEVPPLALMVCDEAHRSSGSLEKAWTVVHHQDKIPALRRLYMTATPRIWAPPRAAVRQREDAYQPLPEDLVCSMDDQRVYGTMAFSLGLAEAVDRKLLAPFEVVVLELRDPESDRKAAKRQPLPWGPGVGEDESGEEDQVRPERLAAIQAGLLKTCVERKLGRVITFHSRTIEARYFAETLGQTAERLHEEHPGKYPDEVWAQWLSGEHSVDFRKETIEGFGTAQEKEGLAHAFLVNCKIVGEGVDIPNADAVLLQGRGSMVDIVQAIGRALRMKPGEGKVASIIVPVFLKAGEESGDLLGSDSYAPLIKILTALRAHDSKVVENLAVPQKSGKRTTRRSAEAVAAPGEGEAVPEGTPAFSLPIRFRDPVDPNVLALFVSLRVLTGESQAWREGIGHARRWHAEHGSLEMPYSTTVGEQGLSFPLGRWLSDRRGEYAEGTLARHRIGMLDDLGMVWSVSELRFETGLDWARVWAKEHYGSLACPARASVGGFGVGAWVASMRLAASLPEGEEGALAPEKRRRLEEIDPWWNPAWPITWQRAYVAARAWWLESDGRVDWPALPADLDFEGEQLGRFVARVRAEWPALEEEQRDLLAAIGIEEDPALVAARAAAAARPKRSQADRFQQGLEALATFVEREGHARVPRAHKETLEPAEKADSSGDTEGSGGDAAVVVVALGTWLNNQKARRSKLTPSRLAQLAELGVEWA